MMNLGVICLVLVVVEVTGKGYTSKGLRDKLYEPEIAFRKRHNLPMEHGLPSSKGGSPASIKMPGSFDGYGGNRVALLSYRPPLPMYRSLAGFPAPMTAYPVPMPPFQHPLSGYRNMNPAIYSQYPYHPDVQNRALIWPPPIYNDVQSQLCCCNIGRPVIPDSGGQGRGIEGLSSTEDSFNPVREREGKLPPLEMHQEDGHWEEEEREFRPLQRSQVHSIPKVSSIKRTQEDWCKYPYIYQFH